jgi:acid phosphatase type 7
MAPRRTLLAAATLAAGVGVPASGAPAATVIAGPALAPPGATIHLEGSGFARNAPVVVVGHRRAFVRTRTGPDGRFLADLVLPRGLRRRPQPFETRSRRARVTNVIRVVGSQVNWAPSEFARSDGLRVLASRTAAFPTAPVRVIADGVKPRARVRASLPGGPPAAGRATPGGRARLALTVPTTRLERSFLDLHLGSSHVSLPFYVLPPGTVGPPLPQPIRPDPIVGAAGDISCRPDEAPSPTECQQQATSDALVRAQPDLVAELGDAQYNRGAPEEFPAYDASWGRLWDRTRPAIGNHEYLTPRASEYFAYFGNKAGEPSRGYYSYDLGTWHVVVLNANCSVVSCFRSSRQEQWLRADLAAHPNRCTLAYWHQPRFSSAQTVRENLSVQPLWEDLQAAGAEVVLTGHVHNYERFAPQSPTGQPDPNGIREFVVGTGGRDLNPLRRVRRNSEARNTNTFGVLFLTLRKSGYDWRFVPVAGSDFTDGSVGRCH